VNEADPGESKIEIQKIILGKSLIEVKMN
jgi:hypothetical protein